MNFEPGDLVLISNFKDFDNKVVAAHPFLITSNNLGVYEGCAFNLEAYKFSSAKDDKQREKYLQYDSNMLLGKNDGLKKESFLILNQLYYFYNNDSLEYKYLGKLNDKTFDKVLDKINDLLQENKIIANLNNVVEHKKDIDQSEELEEELDI